MGRERRAVMVAGRRSRWPAGPSDHPHLHPAQV